jgi:pyrimidine-nucleoside phosphorylase
MRIYDLIMKKRDGYALTAEEINFLVTGYLRSDVSDAQMAAWLMAVYFNGMTLEETVELTLCMVHSGQVLDLSSIPGTKVDKHSTGGVGDKTTLILMPLLAAAGIPVVKMSGRSLGYTGGTLDKLESIPGFSTNLSPAEMIEQVKRIGIAIAGQTDSLVPADKKIYALRDLTATVECIPLIAASVMSKKIAAGADAIVLDVKSGSGAFMQTGTAAGELARTMVQIGEQAGKRTVAVITDMDQPLGCAIGNAIEVREAIETLNGGGPRDLVELVTVLGGISLVLGGKAERREQGEEMVRQLLTNGAAAAKFRELVRDQGGDESVVADPSRLAIAPAARTVNSVSSGYVTRLDALTIARAETALGAGRGAATATPDLSVGIYLLEKIGDAITSGEPLAKIHALDESSAQIAARLVSDAYVIGTAHTDHRPLVSEVIGTPDPE